MPQTDFDVVIIGQGIAGTTLAWALHFSGRSVLLLDENTPMTSSRIAAGLMTPITGKRLVLSRGYEKFFQTAQGFYRHLEAHMGAAIFHKRRARRLFQTTEEKTIWQRRRADPAYMPYILSESLEEGEGFEMVGAQLDVGAYLSLSRDHLRVKFKKINWERDISFHEDYVQVGEDKAAFLISCEGDKVRQNPYFSSLKFNPAKGDILTVRFQKPLPTQTYHEKVWLAPAGEENVFFVGSTYDWENLEATPSPAARHEIEARLRAFMGDEFEVLDHKAAIRPIIFQSMARIGAHPDYPRLGFFNGLGSKGSLQAPWYGQALSDFLFKGKEIEEEANLSAIWP